MLARKIFAGICSIMIAALVGVTAYTGLWTLINNRYEKIAYTTDYKVRHGDSIWRIAGFYTKEGQDIREVVYCIEKDNQLAMNGFIEPGQVLKISVRE